MIETPVIVVVGGGAAGFFSALSAKEHFPKSRVIILEKSNKVLSKVKISGGGRCNVTHACFDNRGLTEFYPRGGKQLRKAFEQFNAKSTVDWFKERGVELVTLPDGCMFPKSDDSQTIINCFLYEAKRLQIEIVIQKGVVSYDKKVDDTFQLELTDGSQLICNRMIITTGGQPKRANLEWIQHEIVEPVPSLFTFNMPKNPITQLMGIVVEPATAKIIGTKLIADGPLLITHWGMSGPAILKLSAWGARILAEKNYAFDVSINWLHDKKEDAVRNQIEQTIQQQGAKKMTNWNPFSFANRLWEFLLEKSEISMETRWQELGKKGKNRLINNLVNDVYAVSGKTTFKEEFVTAGGISLDQIDFQTMESKEISGIFFAGEVLDIDGVTGGFNFQAAWTTGWIAGKNVLREE